MSNSGTCLIVLAMRRIRALVTNTKSPAPRRMNKGGEAPKSACHPLSAPLTCVLPRVRGRTEEGARKRSIADKLAQSAQLILRDRSPSGAPPRRLPRRANARTQSRPRFTRNTMRRRYLRLESRLSEAPRAPVVMPAGTMPGPPGSEGDEPPPAGTASRSVSRRHRLTSLNERARRGAVIVIAAAKSNGLNFCR